MLARYGSWDGVPKVSAYPSFSNMITNTWRMSGSPFTETDRVWLAEPCVLAAWKEKLSVPPKGKVPLRVPVPLPLSVNPKPAGNELVTVIEAAGLALVLTVKTNGVLAVAFLATLLVNTGGAGALAKGVAAGAAEARPVATETPATIPTSNSTILRSMRINVPLV